VASRRWIVVTDPQRKRQLADLYRAAVGDFIVGERDRLAGTGHPMERTMESAAFLVEHLADVPAIVIPTIWGRHDGSGRPGLFDSVIQAAWSFCLALRARGLGTAWTTAIFRHEDQVKELLGIPAETTEIVMLPVAYTIGTDFSPVPRRPASEITYFDSYGHTQDGGVVEIDIDATPRRLWDLVDDVEVLARAADRPAAACTVGERVPNRSVAWTTGETTRWRLELEPKGGATRLRLSVSIDPDAEPTARHDLVAERLRSMHTAVEAIRSAVHTHR
jgi:nitroreductase